MNIKKLRDRLRMTQQELADTIGVSRETVAHWEIGNHEPVSKAIIRQLRFLEDRVRGLGEVK